MREEVVGSSNKYSFKTEHCLFSSTKKRRYAAQEKRKVVNGRLRRMNRWFYQSGRKVVLRNFKNPILSLLL